MSISTPPSLPFLSWAPSYIVCPLPKLFNIQHHQHTLGIQPSLKPQKAADGTISLVAGDAPFIVDYAGPGPPPPSAPHRYVFMLYEQPQGFDLAKFVSPGGKKVGVRPRIRYDVTAFEKEAKLGPVVASNYFFSS